MATRPDVGRAGFRLGADKQIVVGTIAATNFAQVSARPPEPKGVVAQWL